MKKKIVIIATLSFISLFISTFKINYQAKSDFKISPQYKELIKQGYSGDEAIELVADCAILLNLAFGINPTLGDLYGM